MQQRATVIALSRMTYFVVLTMSAWIFTASLIAASSALHDYLHEDAGKHDHQCVFTLLHQQQVLVSDNRIVLPCGTVLLLATSLPPYVKWSSAADNLPGHPRAPPV